MSYRLAAANRDLPARHERRQRRARCGWLPDGEGRLARRLQLEGPDARLSVLSSVSLLLFTVRAGQRGYAPADAEAGGPLLHAPFPSTRAGVV